MAQQMINLDIDRKAALVRGSTEGGKTQIPVTHTLLEALTIQERETLAEFTTPQSGYVKILHTAGTDKDAIIKALQGAVKEKVKLEKESQQRKEDGRRHAAWALSQPRSVWGKTLPNLSPSINKTEYPCPEKYHSSHYQDYCDAYDSVPGLKEARKAAHSAIKAEQQKIHDEYKREKKAEEKAKEEAKINRLKRLAELAAECGFCDNTVRERLAAGEGPLGLLPEKEALKIVRDEYLHIDSEPGYLMEYKPLTAQDVKEYCEKDNDGLETHEVDPSYLAVSTDSCLIEGLTAKEWHAIQSTQSQLAAAGLPKGEIQIHIGQCDYHGCPLWPARRIGLKVTIDLGSGLIITREYGTQ